MKFLIAIIFVVLSLAEASRIYPKRTPDNRRLRTKESFIVGGEPTTIDQYPHSLALLDWSFNGYICGASNISPNFALSAAHCLEFNTPPHLIELRGGSTTWSNGVTFDIISYVNHPNYNSFTLDNDVSVLRSSTPMLGEFIQPIPLPASCTAACCGVCVEGDDVVVSGWGIFDVDLWVSPPNLHRINKAIFPQAQCNGIWGGITSRMFCTVAENGRDSCNGDSGSAVTRNGVQVGIVSFGSEICGDGSAPAVYVRIEDPLVHNFITQQVGSDTGEPCCPFSA